MTFKNILFVADQDFKAQGALEYAARFAAGQGAALTLLSVVKITPLERLASIVATYDSEVEHEILADVMLKHRQAELEDFLEGANTGTQKVDTAVFQGSLAEVVLGQIKEQHYDLVIKAAQPSHSASDRLFGSDDMHLMRMCPTPVWIKRPDTQSGPMRILAAVELVHQGEECGLEDDVLEVAADLAKSQGGELHIIHAWHSGWEKHFSDHEDFENWMPKDEMGKRVKKVHADVKQWFEKAVTTHQQKGVTTKSHLVEEDDPVKAIIDTANSEQIDLLVIGSAGRRGLEGLLIGNTAETLLHSTKRSVLAVRRTKG